MCNEYITIYKSFNFLLNISLSSKNETDLSFVPKLGPNLNFKMKNTSGLLNFSYLRISIVNPYGNLTIGKYT